MAYTRQEWTAINRSLPPDERMTYDQYLQSLPESERPAAPKPYEPPVQQDDRREAILRSREIRDAAATTTQPKSDDPFAGESGWRNEAFGWTADGRLIQRIVGNSGKILGYIYADSGEVADPNAVVPGKTGPGTGGAGGGGTTQMQENADRDYTARDAVLAMFQNLGLGDAFVTSLMSTIDRVYQQSLKPSQAEILNAVYSSDAYKTRFKANEVIRQRMASGKGMAGDRMLTPAEYINLEQTYREYMQNVGMPTGFYDQPEDFTNFIANGVSPSEVKARIDLAGDALNRADSNIVNALRDYYGLEKNDLIAYLVDPNRAVQIFDQRNTFTNLQRAYQAAEVGGAARRQGFTSGDTLSDRLLSEEIVRQGKQGEAEQAFQAAAAMQPDLKRLGSMYGESIDTQDLVREQLALEGGVAAGVKRRKLASKERAMFSQQSAVGRTSLGKETNL